MSQKCFALWFLIPSLCIADIVVDQFGYRTDAAKIALARNPRIGFDTAQSHAPGTRWCLVDSATSDTVLSGTFSAWNGGAVDAASGDQVWSADFSTWKRTGTYTLVDPLAKAASPRFRIEPDPYRKVLRHALRTFFYQRAGQEKLPVHAGAEWADSIDHLKPGQDSEARRFLDKSNATTARDLRGGWFQNSTTNKYTAIAGLTVSALLKAYDENPRPWTDDLDLPESGNGIPDILDEAMWGIRWLERMQNPDGSCLSLALSDYPRNAAPSTATGPSYYGDASTSSTLRCAATFALASSILPAAYPGYTKLADSLKQRAHSAWSWARQYPDSVFNTASTQNGTIDLGYMDQETFGTANYSPYFEAAIRMFQLTGDTAFRRAADSCLTNRLLQWWPLYVGPFSAESQSWIAEYAALPAVPAATRTSLREKLASLYLQSGDAYLGAVRANKDPYRAFLSSYTWGSNAIKAFAGLNFWEMGGHHLPGMDSLEVSKASEEYLHDFHGRNPLGTVFLTNMTSAGATRSTSQLYHYWFADGTNWDQAGVSPYGPPPGYLVSGPNPNYHLDESCHSSNPPSLCNTKPSPPLGQPSRKSWKDFNTSWPQNSWFVNDNATNAQYAYVRLLSKFVGIPAKQTPVTIRPERSAPFSVRIHSVPGGLQVSLPGIDLRTAQARLIDLGGRVIAVSQPTGQELFLRLDKSGHAIGILELESGSSRSRRVISLLP